MGQEYYTNCENCGHTESKHYADIYGEEWCVADGCGCPMYEGEKINYG